MPEPKVRQFRQAEQRPNNYTRELPPIDEERITAVLVRRSKKVKPLSEKELQEYDSDTAYIESREAQLELQGYAGLLYRRKPPKVRLYDEGDGVSGQKRIDQREEMDRLYQDINKGIIGTIVLGREDRLFRNKHMDQVGVFTRLAEEKKIKLIVPPISSAASDEPTRVYDFTIYKDLCDFQDKMREAYGYIEGHVKYMNQCKQNKADKGGYDGRGLPPGLAVKGKKQNQVIVIYEPWAKEMRKLALRAQALDWDTGKLNREVANMTRLFPEIPDEDRDQYTFNTHMHHIPGVGYKPHNPQSIKRWLTNEMYIGWWEPDEDKPDVIIDHHDAILGYALFAEGYARLKGYTLEGEPVDNGRGVKRISKKREDPPDALFHSRLITPPPSPDRTAYTGVDEQPSGLCYVGYSMQEDGMTRDELFHINAVHFDALVVERLKVLAGKDKEIADKVRTTLEQMYNQQGEDFVSIHHQLKGIEEQLPTLTVRKELISEEILKEKLILKKANLSTSEKLEMWEGKLDTAIQEERGLLATQAALEAKKDRLRIVDSPEDIARVHRLLSNFDKVWPKWDLDQRQRAFSLLINRIEIEVISPHWLRLRIDWLDAIHSRVDVAYIWRVLGSRSESFSDQEKEIVKQYYPSSPRLELLKLLPDRSWQAVQTYACREKIKREIPSYVDIPHHACYRDFMPKLDGKYLWTDYETTLKYIKAGSSNTTKIKAPLYPIWIYPPKGEDLASLVEQDLSDSACARARGSGKAAARTERLPGESAAPPTPCTTRPKSNQPSVGANPQSVEPIRNSTSPNKKRRLRPKRSPRVPAVSIRAAKGNV